MFPAVAALAAIYGIFTDPDSIAKHLSDIAGFAPSGAIDFLAGDIAGRHQATGLNCLLF